MVFRSNVKWVAAGGAKKTRWFPSLGEPESALVAQLRQCQYAQRPMVLVGRSHSILGNLLKFAAINFAMSRVQY